MPHALLTALLAISQTDTTTISADRPGFADAASTVPQGHVQIELGARADFDDAGPQLTAPSILVRVGLSSFVEARVSAPDVLVQFPKGGGDSDAAITDLVVGLKVAGKVGDVFAISLVPFASFPTGTRGGTSTGVGGGAGINFELTPTDALQIGWNVISEFEAEPETSGRIFNFGAGLSAGYQFGALGAFVESYIQYTETEKVQPSVAGGLTYLLTNHVQLDLSGGTGLSDDAEPPYVIAGAAFLL
jgi:hypothetical protein